MKRTRNLAFIVELLLLFVILLFVIVVITKTFMTSRSQSLHARHLTEAVCIAEEIAEVTEGATGLQEASSLLGSLEEVQDIQSVDEEELALSVLFAAEDGKQDVFDADLTWEEETAETGVFVMEHIAVFYKDASEPLYTLETGWYRPDQAERIQADES
ncbi:MAG: hypothetical protein IKE31_10495 [Eubacterium sp.]|nr:hypothetical protein [Eubacterium sp.]